MTTLNERAVAPNVELAGTFRNAHQCLAAREEGSSRCIESLGTFLKLPLQHQQQLRRRIADLRPSFWPPSPDLGNVIAQKSNGLANILTPATGRSWLCQLSDLYLDVLPKNETSQN